ncbi:aminoglycoside phosphotransferase family protein [Streptomyces sp. NPDC051940]|uniref:phosphotransferase family protein n=1 Tax=Streptomyces sp. NPDC051940 TaxID=3155675 RepID=UPI0034467EF5
MKDPELRGAEAAVAAALGADGGVVSYKSLDGGTYNTVFQADLEDGRQWVVKLPPPGSQPGLAHERRLLHGEATFYEAAAGLPEVPVPRLVRHVVDGPDPYLVMTACPGVPWHTVAPAVPDAERRRLRRELGRYVARLHTVTGPAFGYPGEPFAPLAGGWREAFAGMTDAVLDDAVRYGAELPVSVERCREVLGAAMPVLDEVTRPALVHFDLWDGNVLLRDSGAGGFTLGGIIDGERMFWGDPVADFVSLALFGDIEDDTDFLAGYGEAAGSPLRFTRSVRTRLALYSAYLYLIMLVESIPRRHSQEQRDWARRVVAPLLVGAVGELSGVSG